MDGLDWIDPLIQSSPVGLGIQSNLVQSTGSNPWSLVDWYRAKTTVRALVVTVNYSFCTFSDVVQFVQKRDKTQNQQIS